MPNGFNEWPKTIFADDKLCLALYDSKFTDVNGLKKTLTKTDFTYQLSDISKENTVLSLVNAI